MKGKTERCSGSLLFHNCKGYWFPWKSEKTWIAPGFSRQTRWKSPTVFLGFVQFERPFPLQALAFRRRSGSHIGAFAPAGSPLDTFFPQESRTLRSNQLCFNF